MIRNNLDKNLTDLLVDLAELRYQSKVIMDLIRNANLQDLQKDAYDDSKEFKEIHLAVVSLKTGAIQDTWRKLYWNTKYLYD